MSNKHEAWQEYRLNEIRVLKLKALTNTLEGVNKLDILICVHSIAQSIHAQWKEEKHPDVDKDEKVEAFFKVFPKEFDLTDNWWVFRNGFELNCVKEALKRIF